MEPHRNIVHISKKHVELDVKSYVFYVLMWFKTDGSSVKPIVT